jgi:hypothetical protein
LPALRASLGTWRTRGAALAVALAALLAWTNPLTNHLGYAAALVAALVTSFAASIVGAGVPGVLRRRALVAPAGSVLLATLVQGAGLVVLFAAIVAVHGLFTHDCTPARGVLFFALLALPGALLGSLCGLVLGAGVRRPALATVLAALVVPAFLVWTGLRFYGSPAVFAYDPFFGFFPGTLYDEVVPLSSTLLTYRLGTLGALVGLAGLFSAFWEAASARLSWRARSGRAPALATAGAGGALMLAVYLAGPALGHRASADEVARALGGRIEGPRCRVLYARSIRGLDARRTLEDCNVRLEQLEAFYGVRTPGQVTVFLFEDAAQKQRWMGAAETYIAKPWRREVYLQQHSFPHPVLKHELAHVVTGAMASWPFYVSVRAGVLPLPGLIEGAAVAGGWEGESDATPHQWSHAMLEAGMIPSVDVLTGLGFFLHGSGMAYTAAGSFSRWLIEHEGAARFREVYRHGDFVRAYGRPLPVLEREWHAFLRTVPVPPWLQVRARTRFGRAALVARMCPHETAELLEQAAVRLAAGQLSDATRELTEVVRNDPTDLRARAALAEAWTRRGELPRAIALADEAARDLGPAAAARMRARIADVIWRWQGPEAAQALYREVDPDLFDEDEARTLEIKRWALGLFGPAPDRAYTEALQDLLIGRGELDPDALAMTARLALTFGDGPHGNALDAPAAYLIGRQLHARERHAQAAALLGALDLSRLPSDRVRAEAERLLAVSLYLSGDRARAAEIFTRLANDPRRPEGARDVARDWLDRIARERR